MNFVDEILTAAGITGGETYWDEQPTQTFAAWGDEISAEGSDFDNELRTHSVTVELYELMDDPSPEAHAALQAALDAHEIPWRKASREVDLTLRLYLTVYTFSYISRR